MEELTIREEEVLKLMSKGLSNKEISQKLNLAIQTLKNCISNIYLKLNISNKETSTMRVRAVLYYKGIQ